MFPHSKNMSLPNSRMAGSNFYQLKQPTTPAHGPRHSFRPLLPPSHSASCPSSSRTIHPSPVVALSTCLLIYGTYHAQTCINYLLQRSPVDCWNPILFNSIYFCCCCFSQLTTCQHLKTGSSSPKKIQISSPSLKIKIFSLTWKI